MENLSINTPALLFPTISLLLLAYTNRYIAISNRIRVLHAQTKEKESEVVLRQISILKKRILLIRDMQLNGILSIFFAAVTMFLIFIGFSVTAIYSFSISMILLMVSLSLAAYDVILSSKAIEIQLGDLDH